MHLHYSKASPFNKTQRRVIVKKRTLITVLFAFCAALLIVSCAVPTPAPTPTPAPAPAPAPVKLPERLEFSTHPAGSAGYSVGAGFSKVASEKGPMMVVVAPTTGPLAWVPQMSDTGNPHLGNANSLDIFWIYFNEVAPTPVPDNMLGDKPFYPKAYKNLRLIAAGGRMGVGFLVRDDSPYKTPSDLKGARFASGYLAQPSAFAPMVADLVNVGLTLKDFREVTVASPAAGIPALGEGRLDVVHCGVGMAQTAEVDAKVKVRYLPASTDPAGVKRAQSIMPGATYASWDPGPPGIKAPIPLLTFAQMIICNESLPAAVVESLLGTWWDNIEALRALHPNLATIKSPQMLYDSKAAMPYHPGAITFFKKKGLWDAKQDTYQQRLLKGEKPFLD